MFVQGDEDKAASFSFEQLMVFLARNFKFNIMPLSENKSGTLFPMIPSLRMKAGTAAELSFDREASLLLDQDDIRYFAQYFEQLKGHHGSTVEPISPTQDSTPHNESISVATFVFVDYFGLLLRSTLRSAIEYTTDYLKQNPDQSAIALLTLLNGLNKGGQFNHIATMASRFLLHGLRLPEWKDAIVNSLPSGARPTVPLYKATGQQFALINPTNFAITLSKPTQLTWVTLQNAYPLSPQLISLVNLLNAASLSVDSFPTANRPTLLPFYTEEPRRFNIRQSYDWRTASGNAQYTLLELPTDLRDFQTLKGTSLNLALKQGKPPTKLGTTGRTELERTELKPEDIETLTNFFWATQVKLSLRRVP